MQKHTLILAGILAALAAPVALSQSLNCAALSNSALVEPAGYAQQCAFTPSANVVSPVPLDPTDLAYVWNFRTPNQGFNSHQLNNMPGLTNLGNPTPAITPFGIDFDPTASTLFAVFPVGAPQTSVNLATINLTNGAPTVIAPVTGAYPPTSGVTDIVINPQTGAAFVSNATALFTINLATGVTTLVGNMLPAGQVMIDLAINCQGQMFGHNIIDDSLYSVNTTTGAATRIGTHGLAANFAQGMDFDNEDGLLYAWIYTGGGTYTYGTFNLATGALAPLNANTPSGEYEGAIRNTCGVVAADLALTQSNNAGGALLVGNTFQKTLTVTNNGPSAATAITVTDTLPAQLTFVSSNCGATAAGQVVTYTIPTLANGATNSCVLTVRIAAAGTITNTAAITASTPADPTPGNNTTTAQIGASGGGVAQTPVPALDRNTVLVLLGLVSALGLLALRQRQG